MSNIQSQLVPGWVYNCQDYRLMFDLSEADLQRKILDFPGGIASFNAELAGLGKTVVSGDPFYDLDMDHMKQHALQRYQKNEKFLREHIDRLKNHESEDIQRVLSLWRKTLEIFLADYVAGKAGGRYLNMQLPRFPFEDHEFELALCRDLLFHAQAREGYTPVELIAELCRVAQEVRVYPLLNEQGNMTRSLGPVMLTLHRNNFGVEVKEVAYELQQGGNAMLRIWAKECVVSTVE